VEIATRFKDAFRPDWVSLQFVPFGFQKRGLPLGLGRALMPLLLNNKRHLMFHELWLGMDVEAGLKHRVWGMVQRELIRLMVRQIRPDRVHTQTSLYKKHLEKMGLACSYLPLFGNIPRQQKTSQGSNKQALELNFVVFGNIHRGGDILAFAEEAGQLQRKSGRKIKVSFLGRCGDELKSWMDAFRQNDIEVYNLGEQPASIISDYLHCASYGLSSTPDVLAEKSGTVAAMIEHELPVICICRNWTPKGFKDIKTPVRITRYKKGNLDACLDTPVSGESYNGVDEVAGKFVKALF
jgi:hypothetical protein